jgi:hypothetical protein
MIEVLIPIADLEKELRKIGFSRGMFIIMLTLRQEETNVGRIDFYLNEGGGFSIRIKTDKFNGECINQEGVDWFDLAKHLTFLIEYNKYNKVPDSVLGSIKLKLNQKELKYEKRELQTKYEAVRLAVNNVYGLKDQHE